VTITTAVNAISRGQSVGGFEEWTVYLAPSPLSPPLAPISRRKIQTVFSRSSFVTFHPFRGGSETVVISMPWHSKASSRMRGRFVPNAISRPAFLNSRVPTCTQPCGQSGAHTANSSAQLTDGVKLTLPCVPTSQALSAEELLRRRDELAKMRSLLFKHEEKSRHLAKIKSKDYHRRLKKSARNKVTSCRQMEV